MAEDFNDSSCTITNRERETNVRSVGHVVGVAKTIFNGSVSKTLLRIWGTRNITSENRVYLKTKTDRIRVDRGYYTKLGYTLKKKADNLALRKSGLWKMSNI